MRSLILFYLISFCAFSFDWQGHRGARGLYPENTIGAMQEALKYPVTTLEMDVVISKDHKVVVSHEPWMNATICKAPDKLNIYTHTYEEIRKYDCGSLAHPRFPDQMKVMVGKPLLSELISNTEILLKKLGRQKLKYSVEIKSLPKDQANGFQPDVATFVDLVIKDLLAQLPAERIIIQSFDWRVLKYLHEKHPEIHVSALSENLKTPQDLVSELGFTPKIFSPYFEHLTKEFIDSYHARAIEVIPWTVNQIEAMDRLRSIGVDGIITDYPNLIMKSGSSNCPVRTNFFEGKCVKLPDHSHGFEFNPGWICDDGYGQIRGRCEKIRIPRHGVLNPDGKTWSCKAGFTRYRDKCKKS